MKRSLTSELASRIMIEQRYTAMKDLAAFRRRMGHAEDRSRHIARFVMANYAAGAMTFSMVSAFLVAWNSAVGGTGTSPQNLIFILFVYSLLINLYNGFYMMSSVRREKLVEPLVYSPVPDPEKVLFWCYILYYGSLAFFVTVPGTVILALELNSPLLIVASVLWTAVIVLLTWPVTVFLTTRSWRIKKTYRTLDPVVRIISFAITLGGLEVMLYTPQLIPNLLPSVNFLTSIIAFPFNIPYIMENLSRSTTDLLAGFAVTLGYLGFSFLAASSSGKYLGRKLVSGMAEVSGPRAGRVVPQEPIPSALERKDRKILIRDSQVSVLMVIPVIVAVPTLFPVLVSSQPASSNSIGIYYLMLSITAICASFYPAILLIAESRSFELWRQLPLETETMLSSKKRLSIKMFALFAIPMTILALLRNGSQWEYYVSVLTGLLAGYTFLMYRNYSHLFSRIPEEADRVNMETFGGTIGLLTLFTMSIFFLVVPVILGTLATEIIPVPGGDRLLANSFVDAGINIALMIWGFARYG